MPAYGGVGFVLLTMLSVVLPAEPAAAQPPSMDEGAQLIVFTGGNRDFPIADLIADGMQEVGFQDVRTEADSEGQWILGLHAGVHLGRFVLGFSEFMVNDTGRSSASGRIGASPFNPRIGIDARTKLIEWTGGLHVQLPAGTWRVRPFFGGGVGLLRGVLDISYPGESIRQTTNDLQYHIDAGVRVFATRHVGVSAEFRSVQIPDVTFYRILFGAVFKVN
jgi:hypothetical protein